MKKGRSNTFNRALEHLKSTEIDEKLHMLSEIPTNNTSGIYFNEPQIVTDNTVNGHLNNLDLDADDSAQNGRDTSGLFMPDGTILTIEPPGDTSYILGPMAAMYYTWSYPWTMIGYIRQSDRKMVNLARVDGKLSDWNGVDGFNSYGQLTLEQAVWFRDTPKQTGANNDPSTYNYYAFYPGPPSATPDADGRYPCIITGTPKRRGEKVITPEKPQSFNDDPHNYRHNSNKKRKKISDRLKDLMSKDPSTLTDAEEKALNDAGLGDFTKGGDTQSPSDPTQSPSDPNQTPDMGGDPSDPDGKGIQPGETLVSLGDGTFVGLNPEQLVKFKAGGGDAAIKSGKSLSDIITQGYKNLNALGGDNKKLGSEIANAQNNKVSNPKKETPNLLNQLANLFLGTDDSILRNLPGVSDVTPPAIEYSTDIAQSIIKGSPVNLTRNDISPNDVNKFLNNSDFSKVKVVKEPVPYADENIRERPDGTVEPNPEPWTNNTIPIYTPPTITVGDKQIPTDFGYSNPIGAAGQSQVQLVSPTDNPKDAYLRYVDHAYYNDKSTDPGETPTSVQGTLADLVNSMGSGMQNKGYPSNIKGDRILRFDIPYDQLPKNLQDKLRLGESKEVVTESRKRILRNIKKPYVIKEIKQKKLEGYRPRVSGGLNTKLDKLMQKVENPRSFKSMDETVWTKEDKYYNARLSQERKNEVLDHLGTGDHYWQIITEIEKRNKERQLKEKYGEFTLVRKEQLVGDTLLFLVDENGKKETILQSEYSDRIARQHEEHLWEQETLNAPNDPLIKRVRNKLTTLINYPDKPSSAGYPNEPPPKMVNGYHPEFGKRVAYYNALDSHSADAMPTTGDPEIDAKVSSQKSSSLKPVRSILKKKGKPNS